MFKYGDDKTPLQMTVSEYFRRERTSTIRNEYVYGAIRAMSGGTLAHNAITTNIVVALHRKLSGKGCRPYTADARVRASSGLYYYPDAVVECGGAPDERLVIADPVLIIEVTSASTQATDRGEKLVAYCGMPSLRTYMMVDSRRRRATVLTRTVAANDDWERTELSGDASVDVPALNLSLTFDEIYDGVQLPALAVREEPVDAGTEW